MKGYMYRVIYTEQVENHALKLSRALDVCLFSCVNKLDIDYALKL